MSDNRRPHGAFQWRPVRSHTLLTCPIQPDLALAAAVSKRVGQARYGLWFEGHARFVPLGREVTVVVRNDQTRDWLEHTFGSAVREAVTDICGSGTAVRWAVDSTLLVESQRKKAGSRARSHPANQTRLTRKPRSERPVR